MEKSIDISNLTMCIEDAYSDNGYLFGVENVTQEVVKNELSNEGTFRMLTNESTADSVFEVDIDDSKFLNDKSYRNNWIIVSYGYPVAVLCVRAENENLCVSAMEVSSEERRQGFGSMLVRGVEKYARHDGFRKVVVNPFDTDAEGFWTHMGYTMCDCNRMYKTIE